MKRGIKRSLSHIHHSYSHHQLISHINFTSLIHINSSPLTHTFLKQPNKNQTFKMQFSTSTIISSLSLLALTQARIIGLSAPATIAAGQPFTVQLLTENYIQSVYDVGAAFGIAPGSGYPAGSDYPASLGTVIGSGGIGAAGSNVVTPLSFTVAIAPGYPAGEAILSTSVMSLYGAVAGPTLTGWNVTVTIGSETSGIVSSTTPS